MKPTTTRINFILCVDVTSFRERLNYWHLMNKLLWGSTVSRFSYIDLDKWRCWQIGNYFPYCFWSDMIFFLIFTDTYSL
jgi:hypothetical protein